MSNTKRNFFGPGLLALAIMVSLPFLAVNAQDSAGESASDRARAAQKNRIETRQVDGKVVVSMDGKVIGEVKIDDPKVGGLVLKRRSSSKNGEDGQPGGRAVLIGPTGTQKVIFDQDLPGLSFSLERDLSGVVLGTTANGGESLKQMVVDFRQNGFSIGVSCSEVQGALKAHLDLEQGLVINEVFDESAAAEAGLQQFDILLSANGEDLNEVAGLIDVIQHTGEEEDEIKLRVLRKGKKIKVAVQPRKNEVSAANLSGIVDLNIESLQDLQLGGTRLPRLDGVQLDLQRVLPGVIQSGGAADDKLSAEIAELRQMIEQLREELRNK